MCQSAPGATITVVTMGSIAVLGVALAHLAAAAAAAPPTVWLLQRRQWRPRVLERSDLYSAGSSWFLEGATAGVAGASAAVTCGIYRLFAPAREERWRRSLRRFAVYARELALVAVVAWIAAPHAGIMQVATVVGHAIAISIIYAIWLLVILVRRKCINVSGDPKVRIRICLERIFAIMANVIGVL